MATFITSKSVGQPIQILVRTSSGFFKYNHNGVDSQVYTSSTWIGYNGSVTVTNANGEFTVIPCDVNGNPSGYLTEFNCPNGYPNQITSFDTTGLNNLTSLNLTNQRLTSFDGTGLSSLTNLNLANNPITSFDGTGLSSLTYLNLANNPITTFIGGDMGLITELNFNGWGGWNIPTISSFDGNGLTSLTKLKFGHWSSPTGQLTSFDGTGLSNLTELWLNNNQLTSFDGTGLSNLTELWLNNNQLTSFDGTGLSNLTTLYLGGNQLTSFDGTDLISLPSLDLSNNQLTSLEDFVFPTNLTQLWLNYNQLTSFDGTGLSNLTGLGLMGNQLTSFDGTGLSNLTNLYLDVNQLTSLDNFVFPTNLSGYLGLSSNQLTSFDGTGLTNLTGLGLVGNQLTSFNGTGLSSLTYLGLDENQISSFDGTGLSSLENLEMNINQLTSFNGTGLTNLTELYLNENQITNFDATDLGNLSTLSLYMNQLTSLDVSNLPNLTILELGENSMMTPSANNQILQQLNQHGVSNGYFSSSNGRTAASNADYNNLLNNLYWSFYGLDLQIVGNGRLAVRGVINTSPFVPQEGSFTVNVTGTEYTYMGIGSSTGYIKIRYWDGVEEILGNGDTSTYVPDEYNIPSSLIWFEKAITDSIPNKTINYYPCLSDGTMSGEIIYLYTQEAYAYQPVLPQTLKGLWLFSYNRSSSLDLTSLTSLETFIYRDSTTLTTIDLSNISTLKLVMVGNQTESVFPLENILISNPSNLDKFKVYGCGISQFDVSTVSNANKLWLEGTSLVSMDLSESNATQLDIRNSQLLTSLSLPTGVINLTIGNAPLLSNLDLTGLSNVTNLNMENVPSLETLDVSDLVNLTSLALQQGWTPDYSAKIPLSIASLDLSNNTLLTHLTYELSIPETLDLTNNNNLILLNVANATNLTSVLGLSDTNIVTFGCSNSQSLDLDSILSDVNLDQLNLNDITNTNLDLSQQTNLTQLSINRSNGNTLLPLESINLSGLNNLGFIGVSKVSGAVLDDALIDLNGNTKTNGYFYNATGRSSASNSAVSGLISKGWTIQSW